MKAYGEITLTVINDGSDGTSPYFISVGNESQNIPCGNDGLASTNFLIEIPFVGYHGVQRIGCVATISSLPNGVTLGENTAATTENDGKIILNVAKGADFGGTDVLTGTIDLSFAIENTTINVVYSSSDLFSEIAATSIYSLLKNNSYNKIRII